jgi:hypothetical protein
MSIEELPTIIPGNILAPTQGFRYPQSYPGARKKRSPPAIFWPPLRGSASFIPAKIAFDKIHCPDVRVDHGGFGEVIVEVKAEKV